MEHSPAIAGNDADIELRDGDARFSFAITGKPHTRHGDKELDPSHGFATMYMQDGTWSVGFVHVYGQAIGKKGSPIKREIHFSYAFSPLEDGETEHPDYAPPQWLVDFITAFENRLNGKTGA